MHLLVLGGTGGTGKLVIEQALGAGHQVRALVRSPGKLTASSPNLEVVTGQATDEGDLRQALPSIDAVIMTLGAAKGTVVADATRALLAGTSQAGVKRVVMMSTFAICRDQLSVPAKLMTAMGMSAMLKDKSVAEALLRDSDIDYTVIYATRLSNGPASSAVRVIPQSAPLTLGDRISRTDVAAWLVDAAVNGNYSGSKVTISGP